MIKKTTMFLALAAIFLPQSFAKSEAQQRNEAYNKYVEKCKRDTICEEIVGICVYKKSVENEEDFAECVGEEALVKTCNEPACENAVRACTNIAEELKGFLKCVRKSGASEGSIRNMIALGKAGGIYKDPDSVVEIEYEEIIEEEEVIVEEVIEE